MTQFDQRYLDPVLTPRHARLVTDPGEAAELAELLDGEDSPEDNAIIGFLSPRGRVIAGTVGRRGKIILESEITLGAGYDPDIDGIPWEAREPRVWRTGTSDRAAIVDDTSRLFVAQSLRLDAVHSFAGWRDRFVALITEEVGIKESKIFRNTATGEMDFTQTFNVTDAIGTYAGWLHVLAMEFGTTDEAIAAQAKWPEEAREALGYPLSNIIQSWLLRESAEAQIEQARFGVKFGLAVLEQLRERQDGDKAVPTAELARSLYTDRPNLSRLTKLAQGDRQIAEIFANANRPFVR